MQLPGLPSRPIKSESLDNGEPPKPFKMRGSHLDWNLRSTASLLMEVVVKILTKGIRLVICPLGRENLLNTIKHWKEGLLDFPYSVEILGKIFTMACVLKFGPTENNFGQPYLYLSLLGLGDFLSTQPRQKAFPVKPKGFILTFLLCAMVWHAFGPRLKTKNS